MTDRFVHPRVTLFKGNRLLLLLFDDGDYFFRCFSGRHLFSHLITSGSMIEEDFSRAIKAEEISFGARR